MNLDDLPDKGAWVKSRPESVQKLFHEFPIGTMVQWKGEETAFWLIGYTEDDELILSDVDPYINYDLSQQDKHKRYICAQHLRDVREGKGVTISKSLVE